MKEVISTAEAPTPVGQYSQAIRAGSMIFCAGQIPLDPKTGQLVSGDIAEQTRQALTNLSAVLKAAGCRNENVVRTTVFVTDLADYKIMNEIYAEFFDNPAPARSTVEVATLPRGARIEIDAIAIAD